MKDPLENLSPEDLRTLAYAKLGAMAALVTLIGLLAVITPPEGGEPQTASGATSAQAS